MIVLEGIEEHRFIDFLMKRLQEAPPENEPFDAKFRVLVQSVEYYLKKEEDELFPEQEGAAENLDSLRKRRTRIRHVDYPGNDKSVAWCSNAFSFFAGLDKYLSGSLDVSELPCYSTICLGEKYSLHI